MAQSIKVDIRGDAGSLIRALRQSETAMRRLQAATRGLAAQDKLTNSAALALTAALERNAAAMEARTAAANRNTRATRDNANATGNLDDQLGNTNIRLGQANAGFYNVAFAMEDAGQFANGFSAGMRAIGNNLSAIALSLSASGASFADFRTFLAGPGGLIIAISAFTAAAQLVPAAMEKMGIGIDEAGEKLERFTEGLEEAVSSFVKLKTNLAEGFEFDEQQIARAQEIIDQRNEELKLQAISNGLSREQVEDLDDTIEGLEGQITRLRWSERLKTAGVTRVREEREAQLEVARSLQRSLSVNEAISSEIDQQLETLETNKAIQEALEGLGGTRLTAEGDITDEVEDQRRGVQGLVSLSYELLGTEEMRLQLTKRIEDSLQRRRRAVFSQVKGDGLSSEVKGGGLSFEGFQMVGARPEGGLRQAGTIGRLDLDPVDDDIKRIGSQFDQLQSSAQSGMASFAEAILTGEQSVSSAFGSFFAMMGNQLIQLGIANIGLGTAGEALRAFVTNPALAIAAGAALLAIGGQLRKRTRNAQTNITSGRGGSISTGSAFVRDPYALSNQRNPFFGGGGASPFNVGYIAPPPPPRNPYAEIRMDAKDFVVSFDDARRELDMVS